MKQKPLLGFSLSNFIFFTNTKLVFILKKLKEIAPQATAVELSHHYPFTDILKNAQAIQRYQYRSFHLPKKGYAACVKALNRYQDKLKLNALIMHPCDIKGWSGLKNSKIPVLIENMDNHKKSFRAPEELAKLFKKHDFNLCLDLNHLKTNGYNRQQWLKQFSSRIKQVHLAGVDHGHYKTSTGINEMRHALCLFDQEIVKNLNVKQYPVILEGVMPPNRWDLAKQEFELVRKRLL
ncbi:MAG: hypothetical protein Q8P32_03510 [Candidatus Komeilibacteria bacterium]|nr:hypothetical protein [Candidatus Komeilibacteria bacterium]